MEKKFEVAKLRKERLRKSLEKVESQATDILSFTLSWNDVENYFGSIESDLKKRSHELETKGKHLEQRSHELEARRKFLEKRAGEMESADGFKKEFEENQKKLDLVKRKLEAEEKKLLQVQKLIRDRNIDLKWMRARMELQKNAMNKDVDNSKEESYKGKSKKQVQFQEKKYQEILKKNQLEEKKLRDLTANLEEKEGLLRYMTESLKKRRADMEMEKRKISLERKKFSQLLKRIKNAEINLQNLDIAIQEKQKEVDSIENRLSECRDEKRRGNRGTNEDEGSCSKRIRKM